MQKDPSCNRVYLTKANNRFEKPHEIPGDPEIIAARRRRNDELKEWKAPRRSGPSLLRRIRLPTNSTGFSRESRREEIEAGAMATTGELSDVHALPESSDEDEEVFSIATRKVASLPTPDNTQINKNKRALAETNGNTTGSRRSKRVKTDAEEDQKPSSQPLQASQMSTIPGSQGSDLFPSQSSQKKRSKTFKRAKPSTLWKPDSTPESPEAKKAVALSVPDAILSTPPSRTSKGGTNKLDIPKSFSSPIAPVQLFLPTFDETQHNIDMAIDDEIQSSHRHRRGSSSSLSSADSLASIQLDKQTKHRLNNDLDQNRPASDVPNDHVLCPRCKRSTLKQGMSILKGKTDVSKLSHKESHKFCYEHRIRDAKQAWKDAHYPDSDLDTLTSSSRIAKYLSKLVPIIQRKQKSFYLDKLDEAIANARGNQGKINRFFSTNAIASTHNGYYGPSGVKRLALAIAADDKITKQFRRAEKSDKAFRSANLARAVDSILLPELLIMLVQDDMYLAHDEDGEAQARKILEESEEIGILLNGNDNDEVDDLKENDDAV